MAGIFDNFGKSETIERKNVVGDPAIVIDDSRKNELEARNTALKIAQRKQMISLMGLNRHQRRAVAKANKLHMKIPSIVSFKGRKELTEV